MALHPEFPRSATSVSLLHAWHIQDDVRTVRGTGNIFLTNIHRVFLGDVADPSLEDDDLRDYFLDPLTLVPITVG